MKWEKCGYFEFRLVDSSGKIVGKVERSYKIGEWIAHSVGNYISEETAKAAVEAHLLRSVDRTGAKDD